MFNSLIFGLFFACGEKENDTSDTATVAEPVDADGDGFVEADDCDDSNADINPDAEELCDGVDNNCDDEIDNDATDALTFYEDYDEDGFGDPEITEDACEVPDGFVDNMDDCDDLEATVNPDAPEICDEMDNNCDGLADDEDPSVDVTTGTMFYADADGDGFGDEAVSTQTCAPTEGYVANMNDCDDTVENIDGDGDGYLDCKGDCDDADAMTFPGAAESDSETECMRDADEDGYGDYQNIRSVSIAAGTCITVELFDSYGDAWNAGAYLGLDDSNGEVYSYAVASGDDCVDTSVCDPTGGSFGGPEGYLAEEVCADAEDLVFNYHAGSSYNSENSVRITDANGMVWEFGPRFTDDAGEELPELEDGAFTYEKSFTKGTDCDDADSAVGTGDLDGDGYEACDTDNPMDCDDSDAAINPGVDADADGFNMCVDCDETNADVNPDAEEVWYDGVDQNCDGWSDYDMDMDGADAMMYIDPADGETEVTWTGYDCDDDDDTLLPLAMEADPNACYEDADGDGYGDMEPSSSDMEDYGVIAGTDCYDSSWSSSAPSIYPGAAYNEPDIDGDGVVDCTEDSDGDGYADSDSYYAEANGTDCDDGSEYTYPGAAENEADPTLCMEDADEDGYGAQAGSWDDFESGTDCDDDDAALNPSIDADADGANSCEDCDDNDASQVGVMAYEDQDLDGYGMDTVGYVCDITEDADGDGYPDYVDNNDDCDDSDDGSYYVGAAYMESDLDGDGMDDCSTDTDGDGYALEGTDCDDEDEYTYPGAAYNETAPLDEECLTDADGDGYAPGFVGECFTVEMTDSYGDGWNGNSLTVYVDGVAGDTLTNQNLTSGIGVETETAEVCVASTAAVVEFSYTAGSFPTEISGSITNASGLVISFEGSGFSSSTASLTFDYDSDGDGTDDVSLSLSDGESMTYPLSIGSFVYGGSDTDDNDASVQ